MSVTVGDVRKDRFEVKIYSIYCSQIFEKTCHPSLPQHHRTHPQRPNVRTVRRHQNAQMTQRHNLPMTQLPQTVQRNQTPKVPTKISEYIKFVRREYKKNAYWPLHWSPLDVSTQGVGWGGVVPTSGEVCLFPRGCVPTSDLLGSVCLTYPHWTGHGTRDRK